MEQTIYTIKDVAAKTGISAYTLRFYDKEGLLPFVKRSPSGIRQFTQADFEPLYVIQCLKRSGMSIKKIREFMDLVNAGDETIPRRHEILVEQREDILSQIQELEEMLDVVNYKCWYYEEAEKCGDSSFLEKKSEKNMPKRFTAFQEKVQKFHSAV